MCCMYKNFFFFFNKNNFFLKSFLLLNNFNFFLLLNNFKNLDLNLIIDKKKQKINFLNTNKINFLNIYFSKLNKLVYHTNNIFNINKLNFFFKYKNFNLFYLNKFNYFFYKKIINLFFQITINNNKFVILDSSYKNNFPLYNYIYTFNNLLMYKKYFFIKSSFFTYTNWRYYYTNFLKKFNVVTIVILDFFHFNKFFKNLSKINLPITALLPINLENCFVDYPIFYSNFLNLEKFLTLNLLSQITFISFNYKNYFNRIEYLKLFYKFYLKQLKSIK